MGGKSEKGEIMEWTIDNTKAIIEKIYVQVKKRQLQGSTFKTTIWEDINKELHEMIGTNYGVEKPKGKFNHLQRLHNEFSTLLKRTGVTWDLQSKKVNAPDEIWQELCKVKGSNYRHIKKHGFEYDYDLLSEIFYSSTATGKLSQASTQQSPTSDEERAIKEDFLSKGVHVDVDSSDDDRDSLQDIGKKRKGKGSSSEHQCKEAKSTNKEMLGSIVSLLSDSISARSAASMAKEERYKEKSTKATSPMTDRYFHNSVHGFVEQHEKRYSD